MIVDTRSEQAIGFGFFSQQTKVQGDWSFMDDWWGGVAKAGAAPAPVVASTIDSHHTRLWAYTRDGRASFGGYSKR